MQNNIDMQSQGYRLFRVQKLWMVKCSIGHEREAVRGMELLIDLEGPMIPMTIINITKEDKSMRDGHRERRYSAKDEKMKDQASRGRGRSSRRDEDDDRQRCRRIQNSTKCKRR